MEPSTDPSALIIFVAGPDTPKLDYLAIDRASGTTRNVVPVAQLPIYQGLVFSRRESALIATRAENGQEDWRYSNIAWPNEQASEAPHLLQVNDHHVFVKNAAGELLAMNLNDGHAVWRYPTWQSSDHHATYSEEPDVLFEHELAIFIQGHTVCAVEANTGKPRWRTTLDLSIFRDGVLNLDIYPIACSAERCYVALDYAFLQPDYRTYGVLYALDRVTGAVKWQTSSNEGGHSMFAELPDVVYTGTNHLIARSPHDGSIRWEHASSAYPWTMRHEVIFTWTFWHAFAVDARSGETLWILPLEGYKRFVIVASTSAA